MKLVLAVVQRQDAGELLDSLTAQGLRVTRISSEGGFLREGNVTLLTAVVHATVTDVAYAVGFHSLSHFCRSFVEAYGVSPAAYRSRAAMKLSS